MSEIKNYTMNRIVKLAQRDLAPLARLRERVGERGIARYS